MTLVKVNNNLSKSIDGIMKEFFNDFPAAFNKTMREDVLHFPPVNIVEKADSYELQVAAPGFEKSDFNVALDQNVLTISSAKIEENQSTDDKMIRKEFSYRTFKRSFTLDEKINAEAISAKYENGILTLNLPKKEEVKQTAREITIQ